MHIQRTNFLFCAGLLAAVVMMSAPCVFRQTPLRLVDASRREIHANLAHADLPQDDLSQNDLSQNDLSQNACCDADAIALSDNEPVDASDALPAAGNATEANDAVAANDGSATDDGSAASDGYVLPAEAGATRRGDLLDAYTEKGLSQVDWSGGHAARWANNSRVPEGSSAKLDRSAVARRLATLSSEQFDKMPRDMLENFVQPLSESAVRFAPTNVDWSSAGLAAKVEPDPLSAPSPNWNSSATPSAAPAETGEPGVELATVQETQLGAEMAEWTGAEIVAWVGDESIVAAEVLPQINEAIISNGNLLAPEMVGAARATLLKRYLKPLIETKLVFGDAKRKLPKENMPAIRADVDKVFEEDRVPKMIADAKVQTRDELDQKLRAGGSSLDIQQNAFFERAVASQWMHRQTKKPHRFSRLQLLDYYNAHIADYETPARARWEQIRVRIDMHESREEARQLLAGWERELKDGAALTQMAKAPRSETQAADDGRHDWTSKGSLVSAELDEALFTLPIGELSQIIDDDRGLSIIRVVEREEMKRKPFDEVQAEIQEKLAEDRNFAETDRFVQKLRDRTTIRTIFDDPAMLPVATRATDALK